MTQTPTPSEALAATLTNAATWRVRLAAARHPLTPSEALAAALAGDASYRVRAAAARHPSTPSGALVHETSS